MFIKFDLGLRSHHKAHDLADLLGVEYPMAVGMLAILWANVLERSPSGDVSGWGARGIARAAGWDPGDDPVGLVDALVKTGWLDRDGDTVTIHNWHERNDNLRAAQKKEYARIRKRRQRERDSESVVEHVTRDANLCHAACHERGEERRIDLKQVTDHSTDLDNSEGAPPPPGFLASLGIPESEDK